MLKHCKLPEQKQERLLEYFVAGTPARTAAELCDVHRNSAIRFFHKLRCEIANLQQQRASEVLEIVQTGQLGRHSRRATGKMPLFGIIEWQDKVFTWPMANEENKKLSYHGVIYGDKAKEGKSLHVSELHHYKMNRDVKQEQVNRHSIHVIESFWSFAKQHLRKFNGIPAQHADLFIKECAWRFNEGSPKQLLQDISRHLTS